MPVTPPAALLLESFDKIGDELFDVVGTLAERRKVDRVDVEPVEEVAAESSLPRSRVSRFLLVAAMTRTSVLMTSLPPTRVNSPSCSTRQRG
jgi:uncharacterized membrane protein